MVWFRAGQDIDVLKIVSYIPTRLCIVDQQ